MKAQILGPSFMKKNSTTTKRARPVTKLRRGRDAGERAARERGALHEVDGRVEPLLDLVVGDVEGAVFGEVL